MVLDPVSSQLHGDLIKWLEKHEWFNWFSITPIHAYHSYKLYTISTLTVESVEMMWFSFILLLFFYSWISMENGKVLLWTRLLQRYKGKKRAPNTEQMLFCRKTLAIVEHCWALLKFIYCFWYANVLWHWLGEWIWRNSHLVHPNKYQAKYDQKCDERRNA